MVESLKKLRQHLLTGVSYMIPFVAAGGILIAGTIAFVDIKPPDPPNFPGGPDWTGHEHLKALNDLGGVAFLLMLPVLAGYIAYSIAGKPGLVAGFIGGYLAGDIKAGFLGAIAAGLLAGYVVDLIKKVPTHKLIRPVMPILVIPIVSSLVVGLVMLYVIGIPIADLMNSLGRTLEEMSTGNAVLLATILGGMIAFDMGGPINKTAFLFAVGMMEKGNYVLMGACAAAICTPPLGMGMATLLGRKLWTEEQRESGYAALGMGMIGITEGAIPFAAADPLRVIPSIMVGSMVAATVAMLGEVANHAPHGGPIVVPVIDNVAMYLAAIAAGTIATALLINAVKLATTRKKSDASPEAV